MSDKVADSHWFEPVAEHLGAAYLRYSFTKGTCRRSITSSTASACEPGMRVLDVGCGPGRHAHELARRGMVVHGIDISARFVELATAAAPDGATFERLDARSMAFDGEFDAVVCLCQGAFGLMTADGDDGRVRGRHGSGAAARRAAGAERLQRVLRGEVPRGRDVRRRHRHQPRAHRGSRRGSGVAAEVDLWTGCYTPRELRLLLSRAWSDHRRHQQRRTGRVRRRRPHHRDAGTAGHRLAALTVHPGRRRTYQVDLLSSTSPDFPDGVPFIPTSKAQFPCPTPPPPRPPAPPWARSTTRAITPRREIVADDLGMSFADAIDGTMVEVEDGQLVNGTVVKIDQVTRCCSTSATRAKASSSPAS